VLDAPVSAGHWPEAGTLTLWSGRGRRLCARRADSAGDGRTIVHAGSAGNARRQDLQQHDPGASMIEVCEGFVLAERLGLSVQTLFDICSKSTSQCWAMTGYCPAPGPVPAAPSNRGYARALPPQHAEDLRLAQQAAGTTATATPLGAAAANLYQMFVDGGGGGLISPASCGFINLQESNR